MLRRLNGGVIPCLIIGALLAIAFHVPAASASELCVQDELSAVKHEGGGVEHFNLPNNGQVWAGTFNTIIDGNGFYDVYCIDLTTDLCYPNCYTQGSDVASQEVVWILNNCYPKTTEPAALASDADKARAVQLAVWHFSDGLNISAGGSPAAVFAAARDIIAAAQAQPTPACPTTVIVDAGFTVSAPGSEVTVSIWVFDQNNLPVANQTVQIEVTGQHPQSVSVTTGAGGEAVFSYTGTEVGEDTITALVDYTLPIGLSWVSTGCQTLVMGEVAPGREDGNGAKSWDIVLATERRSWGQIKVQFKKN